MDSQRRPNSPLKLQKVKNRIRLGTLRRVPTKQSPVSEKPNPYSLKAENLRSKKNNPSFVSLGLRVWAKHS
jgi:hypothetical protein